MRYGRGALPEGFLPVFSVDTEEEAKELLIATCSRGVDGRYYSDELAREQSLAVLDQFSDKLARVYPRVKAALCKRTKTPSQCSSRRLPKR